MDQSTASLVDSLVKDAFKCVAHPAPTAARPFPVAAPGKYNLRSSRQQIVPSEDGRPSVFISERPGARRPPSSTAIGGVICAEGLPGAKFASHSILVAGGQWGRQVFRDPKNAALFTLLKGGVPLLDFLHWAVLQRRQLVCNPVIEPVWKHQLLRDQSVASLSEHTCSSLCSTTATSECSSVFSSTEPAFYLKSADTTFAKSVLADVKLYTPTEAALLSQEPPGVKSPSLKKNSDQKTTDISNGSGHKRPRPSHESAGSKRARASKAGDENGGSTTASRTRRGSARRAPELEGVTECPECCRKGQSIFDPNNYNTEGQVWQYFYCRNADCPKGKSSNRYIGWTVRARAVS